MLSSVLLKNEERAWDLTYMAGGNCCNSITLRWWASLSNWCVIDHFWLADWCRQWPTKVDRVCRRFVTKSFLFFADGANSRSFCARGVSGWPLWISFRQCTMMLVASLDEYFTSCLLWSLYVIGQTIIFLPCDFCLLFSSPNRSGRRLDVYNTSSDGVALV